MKHNFTEKEEEKTRNVGSLIEGIVWVIIMATILIGICCSCTSKDTYHEYGNSTDKVTQQKITLKKMSAPNGFRVVLHKETGIVYISTIEGGITPLYNSDGSLYVLK